MQPAYRRILLKLSGEALAGDVRYGIDPKILERISLEIKEIHDLGVEVGLVIGGGNLFRGAPLSEAGLGRVSADQIGMLATVMNAIALRDVLERIGVTTKVMSAIPMSGVIDHYDRRKAIYHLSKKRVTIFSAGTGNPFFTTDSAACLRGIEIDADIVLKATQVDGIYSADPHLDKTAKRYQHLTYDEVLLQNLTVMDLTAICLCRDHHMPLRVFDMNQPGALKKIMLGDEEGTLVTYERNK